MSKVVSIGTALPQYQHEQGSILHFMQRVYACNDTDKRKLRFLYGQSAINYRYSVLPDYSRPVTEWRFYPHSENLEPFPSLEQRMTVFNRYAAPLSVDAIRNCVDGRLRVQEITHLITVSCTGMSAPGLDLQVMELLDLAHHTNRTSVNFMGCYAAVHALKMADTICKSDEHARVMIVCTELCTLHFQRDASADNIASSLLFGDGSAAVLVTPDSFAGRGLHLDHFYSEVIPRGKKDMSWELSSSGFLMTLSSYIPDLIEEDFESLTQRALSHTSYNCSDIGYWCIHPGGRKILESVEKSLRLQPSQISASYETLRDYGNMSSPTILFVLKKIMHSIQFGQKPSEPAKVFGAAFGPGLTMETFVASVG